ncbi:hypothetical protein L208DRAFT_1517194 [Tricholoma matsutake]|nr:hypothetical protein L208DRAFT_1517194 [Tricholoma matsutake 945]
MHKAIRWGKNDPFLEWDGLDIEWSIISNKGRKQATKRPHLDIDYTIPDDAPKKRWRLDMFCDDVQKLKMIKLQCNSVNEADSE